MSNPNLGVRIRDIVRRSFQGHGSGTYADLEDTLVGAIGDFIAAREAIGEMDYADHPQTMGEFRAERKSSGMGWSPRDALISILRDIDSKEVSVVNAVIVYQVADENGGMRTAYTVSCRQGLVGAVGILARGAFLINSAST